MDTVRNNPSLSQYQMDVGGATAVLRYRPAGDTLHLVHTETPIQARGQGIASRLVRGALDDIRSQGLRVVPHCSFLRTFIEDNPEYRDLVA